MHPIMILAFRDELEKLAAPIPSPATIGRAGQWLRGLGFKGWGGTKRQLHSIFGGSGLRPAGTAGAPPDESLVAALRGLVTKRRHLAERWGEMKTLDRAMMAGMTGMGVPEAIHAKGKERSGAIGGLAGGTLGMVALNRVPMLGGALGWMGSEWLGRKAGRGVGHVLGQR